MNQIAKVEETCNETRTSNKMENWSLTSQQDLGHITPMENFSNVTFPKVVLRKLNLVSKLRLFCHMLFCFAFSSEVFILASQNSTLPVVWSSLWPPCRRPQQELVKFNFSQCLEFDFQGIVEITLTGESTELRGPWFIYSSGNGGIFFFFLILLFTMLGISKILSAFSLRIMITCFSGVILLITV